MNQFIQLPSGLRVNTAHILEYREESPGKTKIVQVYFRASEPILGIMVENMTAAELDALLSPQTSAIISPVIDLDKLKPGAGCQFTYEGLVKHGVISSLWTRDDDEPQIDADSDGVRYTIFLGDGTVLPQSLL